MKCENCSEREATVHYTEIENSEKREIHLCEECYREKLAPIHKVADFSEILKGLLQGSLKDTVVAGKKMCPTCGISMAEFRASGRFGCPQCYKTFEGSITSLLDKIQHSSRHMGKVPSRAGIELKHENELIRLRRDLERAVQREEYELAAELRDRIRKLTAK